MKKKRLFFSSYSFSIFVIVSTIFEIAIQLQSGSLFVGASSNTENKISLTDIDDLELDPRQLLLGANNTLAALALLALAGLTLAGLAGLAYLLWTRGDGGGDNHYYYSSSHGGGGYDHIDHVDHGDYEEYDDYYRRRKRSSTKLDEQVACKLGQMPKKLKRISLIL